MTSPALAAVDEEHIDPEQKDERPPIVPMSPPELPAPYGLMKPRATLFIGSAEALEYIRITELGLRLDVHGKSLDDPILPAEFCHDPPEHRSFDICTLVLCPLNNAAQVRMVFGERNPKRERQCIIACQLFPAVIITYTEKMTWRELAWRLNGYPNNSLEVIREVAEDRDAPFPH